MTNKERRSHNTIIMLLNTYLFLFIFTMINREFKLFNFDIRYILVLFGILLIAYKVYTSRKISELSVLERLIYIFLLLTMISNISWLLNGLSIGKDFIQYNILMIFNIMTISILVMYKSNINIDTLSKYIFISGGVLFFSIIVILLGGQLRYTMDGTYSGIFIGGEHINFFGGNFRVAGYAQDSNHAGIYMIIIGATALWFCRNKLTKYLIITMSVIGFMISGSRTIAIGLIVSSIMVAIMNSKNYKINRLYNPIKNLFVFAIMIGPYIVVKLMEIVNINVGLDTMNLRFIMWKHAVDLFEKSPIIGNGLTSYRSFLDNSVGNWYVQSHSTILQIMSETGMISLIVFGIIFYYILKIKNSYVVFITCNFLVFSLTYELNYLSLLAFILGVLPIIGEKYPQKKNVDLNKVLFIINSLGNGGAERVVANSANEMAKDGKHVTILTIKNIVNYEFDEKVKIISLNEKENTSKIEKVLNIPLHIIKMNTIISKLESNGEFSLISSHLPITHIISRFLLCRDRILFVLHNPHYHLDKNNSIIFKTLLRLQYNNMKLIAVSKGVEDELVKKYGVKTKYIKTIYNPINIENILENVNEELDVDFKYLLFCGRLTAQKRPDRLIDAFYKGEFYKDYKLVLLGAGELYDELVNKCKDLGIYEHVIFAGWQKNVYKWMKNCEIMISTSDYESFGMNLVEALACSAKVVSVDCDFGPSEILVDEHSKYLVELDNMNELIETMYKALNDYPTNGFEKIKRFDCKNINKDYIETSLKWIGAM